MSRILKHDQSTPVSVSRVAWTAPEGREPTLSPAEREHKRLKEEIAHLRDELERASADAQKACARAREEGRRAGEESVKRDEAARLALLKAGVKEAVESANQHFAKLDRLAIAIAETALASAFDEAGPYRDQIVRAIRRQTAALAPEAVLKVEVSSKDFEDGTMLTTLANDIRRSGLTISASDTFAPGSARIVLSLGEIEVDLPRYWREVRDRLVNLATHTQEPSSSGEAP